MGFEQKFSAEKLTREQSIRVREAIDKVLLKYKPKIVSRSQTVHPYNNQTYRLTHTTSARYINYLQTLTIFAPAQNPRNGYYYGKKVAEHYNENWLETSPLSRPKANTEEAAEESQGLPCSIKRP